jgi:hypothetical protein
LRFGEEGKKCASEDEASREAVLGRCDAVAPFPKLCKSLEYLVDRWGPVEGRTRFMKLIYLADLEWARTHGNAPYTEANYYRWNHGPFSREVLRALEWMDGIEIVTSNVPWDGGSTFRYSSGESTRLSHVSLDQEFVALLDAVGSRWRSRPLRELLEYVYGDAAFTQKEFGEHLF